MEIEDLKEFCKKMKEVKEQLAVMKKQKTELENEYKRMKAQAVAHLDEHKLDGFNFGEGKISITTRRSVSMIDKYKFFDWLKAKGKFEENISINSGKLNTIYNEELVAAEESGDLDFIVNGLTKHGLSKPNVFRDVRILK